MEIGFVGLGKLGLPVSVAIAQMGHSVYGYDVDQTKLERYRKGISDLYEPDLDTQLQAVLRTNAHGSLFIVNSVRETVLGKDIVFIAVPTPSTKQGNFDLSYVVESVEAIGQEMKAAESNSKLPVVTIISTMLPMSMRKHIAPAFEKASGLKVSGNVGLAYSPQFIAMGTTIWDYLNPEFCLIGESDPRSGQVLEDYYQTIVSSACPKLHMSWENAEATKMGYNTMIGFKIVYANTLMEMCHKMPYADVDVISNALSKATVRIVGPRYLRGGMGDSGACHPRDNLALSWLSRQLKLAASPFGFVMEARANQAEWLAKLLLSYKKPVVIMGVRYKPNTNLIDGSSSLQVADFLKKTGIKPLIYDPLVNGYSKPPPKEAATFLIAQDCAFVHNFDYPPHSVIVDVWRCFSKAESDRPLVRYIAVGRHPTQ